MSTHHECANTEYWEYHPDQKPTIVMVHGLRGTHHGLELIAKNLPGYRIIIPDLPGFGQSAPMGVEHSIENYSHWLDGFIESLNLKAKPILLGHSFGSIISAHYAVEHSDKIAELILVNPIGAPALEGPRGITSRLAVFYYWLSLRLPEPLGTKLLSSPLIVNFLSFMMTKSDDKTMRQYVRDQHLKHFSTFANKQVVYEAFQASISHDVREVARRIPTSTLLIAGDIDDVTPLKKQVELEKMFPNAQLKVLRHVGHLTHYEMPAEVAAAIDAFCSR